MIVSRKTRIIELVNHKKAQKVLAKYGLQFCYACPMAAMETLEDAVKAHGLDEKTLKKILDEINK